MTNEQAINILRSIRVYDVYPKSASEETKQAIDLAIEALEILDNNTSVLDEKASEMLMDIIEKEADNESK